MNITLKDLQDNPWIDDADEAFHILNITSHEVKPMTVQQIGMKQRFRKLIEGKIDEKQ